MRHLCDGFSGQTSQADHKSLKDMAITRFFVYNSARFFGHNKKKEWKYGKKRSEQVEEAFQQGIYH